MLTPDKNNPLMSLLDNSLSGSNLIPKDVGDFLSGVRNQEYNEKVKKFTDLSSRLNTFNLTNKRTQDTYKSGYNQNVEKTDYAAFLIDSGAYYKTNRFMCTIFPPAIAAVKEYYNKSIGGFRFSVEGINIPSQTIETFDYKLGNNNPIVKMPIGMNFGDSITLTFRMTKSGDKKYMGDNNDFLERKMFLTWQEHIFTYRGEKPGARYMNEYALQSSIVLSQIDTASNKIYNTEFTNVYPMEVAGIDYNWSPSDDYVRQNVTFAFHKMFSEGTVHTEK